jgi:hypothetical protein
LLAGSSSPDEGGFISTTGNKGSSVSTPGTVGSTPSSEALDTLPDLRHDRESSRFRSLPHSRNNGCSSKLEPNGNNILEQLGPDPTPNMSVPPMVGTRQYHQPAPTAALLNGNSNSNAAAQNIEDLYAKVSIPKPTRTEG